jgi:hypothetical protein
MTETPALEIGQELGGDDAVEAIDAIDVVGDASDPAGAAIGEALAVIDRSLAQLLNRELVSTDEVADLLLDVRSLLTKDALPASN